MNQLNIKQSIESKKIVIFGAGKLAITFFKKYQSILNICYFTSNDDKEKEFGNLQRLEPGELVKMKDIYIVICMSESNVYNVEIQLSMQFAFGKDYISYDLFEALLEETKEILLIIGQCQQKIIEHGLRSFEHIRDKYIICFFWYSNIRNNIAAKRRVKILSELARYVIILNNNIHQEILCINEKVRYIKMPFWTMPAIYPQVSWVQNMGTIYFENPELMKMGRKKRYIGDIRAFRWADNNIVRMVKAGMSENEILKKINSDNYYDKEFLFNMIKRTENLNKKSEEGADLRLSDYIMMMYKNKKLFLDGLHYSNHLAWKVIEEITGLMKDDVGNIQLSRKNLILELSEENGVWENECPIYPSVWKNLGLEWVDKNTQYTMVKLSGTEKISFEEYMSQCICYTRHALEIERLW